MSGQHDPRVDRLIAAVNTLQSAGREQGELLDRLRAELVASSRDAAEAREAAAHARAETASYHAELTALARRGDLDRVVERLEATAAKADQAADDAQAAGTATEALRAQVARVGEAVSAVSSAEEVSAVERRVHELDQRIEGLDEDLRVQLTRTSGETTDVTQALDQSVQRLEARVTEISDGFEALVRSAESEMRRVTTHYADDLGRLEAQVADQTDAIVELSEALERLPDAKRVADLASEVDATHEHTARLETRIQALAHLGDQVSALIDFVNSLPGVGDAPSLEQRFLDLQNRFERVVAEVSTVGTLRERLVALERSLDRARSARSDGR